MGLLDTLKEVKNFITGGGAIVTLEIEEPVLKKPFKITVKAQTEDTDLEIKGVSLAIKSVESVVVHNVRAAPPSTGLPPYPDKSVRADSELYKEEFALSNTHARLLQKQVYTWVREITLGEKALPTFQGKNAKHIWYVQGSLLVTGKNPTSGWVEFIVQ